MIPLWHVLAARAALALRRHRGRFAEDLNGACCVAVCLLAITYEAHGIACVNEGAWLSRYDCGHEWIAVGGVPVDITATQFGYPELVRLRRVVARPKRREIARVSYMLRRLEPLEHRSEPRRNFGVLVPALADTLGITRREARRRVRAFVGSEVRS